MIPLLIIGAGGFGREVLAWARNAQTPFEVRGFLDDNSAALDGFNKSVGVLGSVSDYEPRPDERFVCAMGNIAAKKRCVELIRSRGGLFATLIHASAVVGDDVRLGQGVILCPHSVVGSDAVLEDFVSINLHSTVAHDVRVGIWTQVHCHADITGGVHLGKEVLIGSHASVLPGLRVGDRAVIGAGSIVMRDVPEGTTVFGVPARPHIVQGGSS